MNIKDSLYSFANPDSYVPQTDSSKSSLITLDQFKKFSPKVSDADAKIIVDVLNNGRLKTKLEVAHFIAQAAHESTMFTRTTENMNYSAEGLKATFGKYFQTDAIRNQYARKPEQIGNRAYASRNGNGPESSGDGYLYRGRGYFQLTGKTNYTGYSMSQYGDLRAVNNPDLVAGTMDAILSSLYFWETNGLSRYANKDDVVSVSKIINLGRADHPATPNGMDDRRGKLLKIKEIMGI
jgi:putative chitinase